MLSNEVIHMNLLPSDMQLPYCYLQNGYYISYQHVWATSKYINGHIDVQDPVYSSIYTQIDI